MRNKIRIIGDIIEYDYVPVGKLTVGVSTVRDNFIEALEAGDSNDRYQEGYDDGYEAGKEDGYEEGLAENGED